MRPVATSFSVSMRRRVFRVGGVQRCTAALGLLCATVLLAGCGGKVLDRRAATDTADPMPGSPLDEPPPAEEMPPKVPPEAMTEPQWCTDCVCAGAFGPQPQFPEGLPPAVPPIVLAGCWSKQSEFPPELTTEKFVSDDGQWVRAVFDESWAGGGKEVIARAGDAWVLSHKAFGPPGPTPSVRAYVHRFSSQGDFVGGHVFSGMNEPMAVLGLPDGRVLVGGWLDPRGAECASDHADQLPPPSPYLPPATGYLTLFDEKSEESWTLLLGVPVHSLAAGPAGSAYVAGIVQTDIDLGEGPIQVDKGHVLLRLDVNAAELSLVENVPAMGDGPQLTSWGNGGVTMAGWMAGYFLAVPAGAEDGWQEGICAGLVGRAMVSEKGGFLVSLGTRQPGGARDWLSILDPRGKEEARVEMFGDGGGIYRFWGGVADQHDWIVVANSGFDLAGAPTKETFSELLRVKSDGEVSVVDRFALRELYTSPPVPDGEGAVVVAGTFLGASDFGLNQGILDAGPGAVFLMRRTWD